MAIVGANAQEFPKPFSLTGKVPLDARQIHNSLAELIAWANDPKNSAFEQEILTALVDGKVRLFILKGHTPTGEDDTVLFDVIDVMEEAAGEATVDWETL